MTEVNNFLSEEDVAEVKLFDDSILLGLNFEDYNFKPEVSAADPGHGLKIRALSSGDYDRGHANSELELYILMLIET